MTKKIGKFITFEGGEGSGKSTQAKLLFEALNDAGIPTILTREPGGSDGAEIIRELLITGETGKWDRLTETLLFFAARRDHVEKLIKPALGRGEWVICDRFTKSTMAYQGYGHGVQMELIEGLHKLTLGDFWPDLTFIYDIDIEKGIARAHAREDSSGKEKKEDRFERMGDIFHKNVRRGFLELSQKYPEICVVINADDTIFDIHTVTVMNTNSHFDKKIVASSKEEIDEMLV